MANVVSITKALLLRWPLSRRAECAVCGRAVGGFLPYRGGWTEAPDVLRSMDVVGSDLDNYECPRCGAHDRERHLLLYLRACRLWDRLPGMRILHAAPERRLSPLIAARSPARHLRCDLFPSAPDIERVDLQRIGESDGSFDLVIANHVLEHVADLGATLSEIARVLAPEGHAVLQTPFAAALEETLEDPAIRSASERLARYGQEDHVRLFGRDIIARFANALGATWVGGTHAELLPEVDPDVAGVNAAEPFMLFRKR